MLATVDFETYSEAALRKTGAYRYAEDESTRVLSLAYSIDGDMYQWSPGDHDPHALIEHIMVGGALEAHNSFFEHCIWSMVILRDYPHWPRMPLHQWRCSMAKARACAIPGGLDAAGEALGLEIKKDKRGKYLIQKLCKPGKLNGDEDLLWELYEYNISDVDAEIELSKALPDMPKSETDIWLLDQKINLRGVYIDIHTVKKTIAILEQTTKKYSQKITALSGGAFSTIGQRAKIMQWCESKGFPLPGFTKTDVVNALGKPDIPEDVRDILKIRQLLGKTSTAKYKAMVNKTGADGRVHEVLAYHKAITGRWGGAGIQVQNLPRPTLDSDPESLVDALRTGSVEEVDFWFDSAFEVASSAIRSMIMAPPGKKLISADYSSIEARVLLWLADDQAALDVFRRGECIYCKMAADIYDVPYKVIFSGYKNGEFKFTNTRAVGKSAVLGLGYQMGAGRFKTTCENITEGFAKQVVETYRSVFKKIVAIWHGYERAAKEALRQPGKVVPCGRVRYKKQGIFLLCKLPSGRCLHYPYAKLETGGGRSVIQYKSNRIDTTTYGGKLVENVCQAVSRDIMCHAMLSLDKTYPIIMCVHDEIVSEVDEDFGSVDEYCNIMCDLPAWADNLPITATGWQGRRYRK